MHGSRSFNFYTRQTRSRGIEALEAREMLTGVIVETLPLLVGGATTSPSPGAQLTSHAAVQVVHNFGDGRPDDRSLDVMEVGGTSYVHDPDSQEVVLALPDIPNPDEAWHEWRIITAASNESETQSGSTDVTQLFKTGASLARTWLPVQWKFTSSMTRPKSRLRPGGHGSKTPSSLPNNGTRTWTRPASRHRARWHDW